MENDDGLLLAAFVTDLRQLRKMAPLAHVLRMVFGKETANARGCSDGGRQQFNRRFLDDGSTKNHSTPTICPSDAPESLTSGERDENA